MKKIEIARTIYRLVEQQNYSEACKLIECHQSMRTFKTYISGGTWLHYACYHDANGMVEQLISMGFDPNDASSRDGSRPLEYAASKGNLITMGILLNAGAVLDTSSAHSNALFSAIVGGHLDAVQMLIRAEIDIFVGYGDRGKVTALVLSLERNELEIADLIAEEMCDRTSMSKDEIVNIAMQYKRDLTLSKIIMLPKS